MAASAVSVVPHRGLMPDERPSQLFEGEGLALRIFDTIEPGYGIVPIVGESAGSHLLKQGEIAVYDEGWRRRTGLNLLDPWSLHPGLYCLERQRAPSGLPNHLIAARYAQGDTVRWVITREVVFITRWPRDEQHWMVRGLRSKVHNGLRIGERADGPYEMIALSEMLLGPIVGIYRPEMGGDA